MINDSVAIKTMDGKDTPADNRKGFYQVSVCICTFKRTYLLRRLLESLSKQSGGELFSFSIVVADNDCLGSAEPVVTDFAATSPIPVTYCVEPQQNIAMARNTALSHADGDFAVFIDDDEFPQENWLEQLVKTCLEYDVDGVLGPVNAFFEGSVPDWIRKGGFFDRPTYATGFQMSWAETRTGNVLLRRAILQGIEKPFRPEFATAGEDMDFFRRMMESGSKFVWCSQAVVYESVPESRCTRSYLLKRALLRGSNFPKHPKDRAKNIAKSLVAIPCYTLALPILGIVRRALFMKYLVKLTDHASRLLAFAGLRLMTERET